MNKTVRMDEKLTATQGTLDNILTILKAMSDTPKEPTSGTET